jgi:hypothetical protein
MRRPFVRAVVLSWFVAACAGSTQGPAGAPTSSAGAVTPPATTAPALIAVPTVLPTELPVASASADRTEQYLVAWQSSSTYAEADVVVAVKNTGGTWIRLNPGQSDYTIASSDGTVEVTGSFLYAYPPDLAPGQTGYLAEDVTTSDAKARDLKTLDTNVYFDEIDQTDAVVLTTAKITNRKAQYSFEGPTTSGTVTNTSSTKVDAANVGAFYFDGSGKFLGFSWTNLVENLEPGQTKGFVTVDGAPYILLSHIKKTVVFAASSY